MRAWLAALVCLLLACSAPPEGGPVELEFWTQSLHPAYDEYLEGLFDRFEAEHPGVRIHWVDLPQKVTPQKLMATIAGGVSPDLVNLNTEMALALAQNEALVDLEPLLTPGQREAFFPGLWEATRLGDAVYAVPWYVSTRVLMYNKNLFREAGLDPESPPRSWEQVEQVARAVRQRTDAFGYMPPIKLVDDWSMFGVPVVEGGRAVFDRPEAVQRLEWYVRLYADGVIPRETLTEGYNGAIERFKGGSLAILEAGPQFLLKVKSDAPQVYAVTGVAPYPRAPTDTLPAATMDLAIPRPSRHRQLALELALFVTSPENQLAFCRQAPILPTSRAAARDPFFQQGVGEDPLLDQAVRISIEQLERARDFSLGLPHQQDLNRALKEALEAAMYGRSTPREALRNAALRWNGILGAGKVQASLTR
ncbi:MAG: sugar ABC transporter substrate-binding protein [Candidatus Eremiobacterota bacterium]